MTPPDPWAQLTLEFGLSSEELQRLQAMDAELLATSSHTNLVARASLPDRFERHYRDSLQLWPYVEGASGELLDIGSGAGFPALALACLAESRAPLLRFTLCDSVRKKASFLSRAGASAGLSNVSVRSDRVETFERKLAYDVITARAVTALPALLELAIPRLKPGGLMIFPKGRRAQVEVDAAQEQWSFQIESRPSLTDPEAAILLIREPKRRR